MVCWQGSCVTKASIRLSDCNPAHCSSIGGQCSSVFPRFPLLSNSPAETTAPIIQNNNPNISNSIYPILNFIIMIILTMHNIINHSIS